MHEHPQSAELRAALEQCQDLVGAWAGVIYRFVTIKHASRADLLSGAGSRHFGGRWNPPGRFNAIYGSLDPQVAILESVGMFRDFAVRPEKVRPRVFVALTLRLQSVLDVTKGHMLDALDVTAERLTSEDWQVAQNRGEESLTQAIGRIAWEMQLEALLVPSARQANATNLVLFPGRRRRGSSWRIHGARDLPKND